MACYVKTVLRPWNKVLSCVLCIKTTIEVGHYMVLVPPPLPPPRALGS